ncbi:alpha/beta fold hydrolase [Flavitalea flava]
MNFRTFPVFISGLSVILFILYPGNKVNGQDIVQRNLLHRFSKEQVSAALLPYDKWRPFPRNAQEWKERLPDSIRLRIIGIGEKQMHDPFAALPATLYLEFQRNGNRTNYEKVSFEKRSQLFSLVLAESMEQKGRFTDAIINGVWSLCEESFWGVPAHYYLQKAGIGLPDVQDPSVDLFASETAEVLALTDYFVGPQLDSASPLLRKRIYYEVNKRILAPLEKDSIAYSYLGAGKRDAPVNNWNAWVISNWMISLLLLEKEEPRRLKELMHGMGLLDNYINGLGGDGAVDEGPSYWFGGAGRLFDGLTMLESATGGKVNIYQEPVIRLLGSYIAKMHVAGNYFINIADASPTIGADGLLIYRVGKSIQDPDTRDFGAWAYHHLDDGDFFSKDFSKPRIVWNLLTLKECAASNPAAAPAAKEVWFPDLQLMAGSTGKGLFVASHAGHNGESHNHNDVGDVLLYSDGEPVLIDVGFGTYNKKTFSKDRYDLWYLNSAHHNLPLINGVQQAAGRKFGASGVRFHSGTDKMELQMDIASAYPQDAGVKKWNRTVLLDKLRNELSIHDEYILDSRSGILSQTFMTVCAADLSQPGRILFKVPGGRSVQMDYDAKAWDIKKELMETNEPDEKRIADNWGNRQIWRLLLVNKTREKKGAFRYLLKQEPSLAGQSATAYQDLTHDSKVFGHPKYYRLYLPKGYGQSTRRYPVIYFFHGWGGRHFMDDNAKLEYTKLKTVVDKYQVILVMWDGNIDMAEPRPYNVGNHEDIKFQTQMKDYFPELVGHIDSSLRTLTGRNNRGIIGFSMGGFMSLYLAGKYPDRVSAAVSLAGSPEFFVGYPDNQELYPVRYTFMNLRQVDTRIHNGNTDILYFLNEEVHSGAIWDEQIPLQYWTFPGGHMVDKTGETKVFEKAVSFVTHAFKKHNGEVKNPVNWSHYDLYPTFTVWDYQVESDKDRPGFLLLKNVDRQGFGFYTQRWLPNGPALKAVHTLITTAPLYEPNKIYSLAKYQPSARATGAAEKVPEKILLDKVQSDGTGRIKVDFDGDGGEAGIFSAKDAPEYVFLDYSIGKKGRFLANGPDNLLTLRLFNRGGENKTPGKILVTISTKDPSVMWKDTIVTMSVSPDQRLLTLPPFILSCYKKPPPHAEPADIRFHITVSGASHGLNDEFTVPVFFKVPPFDRIRVDDGRQVRDTVMGNGNGDGLADPGERIMLYQGSHRLRLYYDDPWVVSGMERQTDEMIPARWPDGFTLSSVIELDSDCPDGHAVEFLACYETKTFNPIERKLTWGRVTLKIKTPLAP